MPARRARLWFGEGQTLLGLEGWIYDDPPGTTAFAAGISQPARKVL
jgi:hypothetical protein